MKRDNGTGRHTPEHDHSLQDPAPAFGELLLEHIRSGKIHAPLRRIPRDVSLYSWGDAGDWLYLVQSGWVKSLTWSWRGKPCLLGLHGAADVLGASGLVSGTRTETAVTKTPASIRAITGDQFRQALSSPGMREAWHRFLAERIGEQQEALLHFVTLDSKARLAATLLRLGRRYGTRADDRLSVDVRMTHEELAQMVGTTRSRIGFFLKEFQCDAAVSHSPSSLVVDDARLEGWLQQAA